MITQDTPVLLVQLDLERILIWLPPVTGDRRLDPQQHDARTLQQVLTGFASFDLAWEQCTRTGVQTTPAILRLSPEFVSGFQER
jgi:hypothetical protein